MNFLDKLKKQLSSYTRSKVPPKPLVKRSPEWRKVRAEFIRENGGRCALCGLKTNLEVHHIIPVHLAKDRELDKTNLLVLCENKSIYCHFVLGHLMNWMAYNPTVVKDVKSLSDKIVNRPYTVVG